MEKTSIERALEVLDLIDEDNPTITQELVAERLDLTRSTAYRYLKLLCDAGMLVQLVRGRYSLGPRIIELDRKIRMSDPLVAAGGEVMPRHANAVAGSVLVLCGLWGDRVICVHQEAADDDEARHLALRRARGRPFPLFRGAASLAILANLPNARVKSLYLKYAPQIAEAGLGATWAEFRKRLLTIRQTGHVVTQGTFESGLVAAASPVLTEDGQVAGSLTRVLRHGGGTDIRAVVDDIVCAAGEVSRELFGLEQGSAPERTPLRSAM